MTFPYTLLDIEDRLALWEPECFGFKLWPLLRFRALKDAQSNLQGKDFSSGFPSRGEFDIFQSKHWPYHLRAIHKFYGPLGGKQHDVCFFTSSNWRYTSSQDASKSTDILYGPCFSYFMSPLILESGYVYAIPAPDYKFTDTTYSADSIQLFLFRLQKRIKRIRLPNTAVRACNDFAETVAKQLDLEEKGPAYSIILQSGLMNYLVWRTFIFERLPHCLTQKRSFVATATYLGAHSIKTKLLHDLGHKVYELQHGGNFNQPPYQFSTDCLQDPNHPCRAYLPDAFLTFGEYWHTQMRLPCPQYPIGKAFLNRRVNEVAHIPSCANHVLIISQPTVTRDMVNTACHLARACPDYRIMFKLHPREIASRSQYEPLRQFPNIHVKEHEDIYPLIAECETIVGYYSTALFEALAFPDKRIFFMRNDFIPEDLGQEFEIPEDLVDMLKDSTKGLPRLSPQDVWANDWDRRFMQFRNDYVD